VRVGDRDHQISHRLSGPLIGQMRQEEAEELQKKIMSAKFDFNDFLKQTRAIAQMGSMAQVIGMVPGMSKVGRLALNTCTVSLSFIYKGGLPLFYH